MLLCEKCMNRTQTSPINHCQFLSEFDGDLCQYFDDKSKYRKWDANKTNYSLLIPEFLELAANILTQGAVNHPPEPNGDPSWMYVEPEAYMKSMLRHIQALRKGEQLDQEMRSHHCGHVFCNAMFLWYLTFYEQWLDVPGYEGKYQASNTGKVRSLDRMIKSNGGLGFKKGKILRAYINEDGYHVTTLYNDGVATAFKTHQVIAKTFIGPCPEGQEVMHLDGDRGNPAATNLRYGTRICNSAFMVDHGTDLSGERNGNAKLTWEEVRDMRKIWEMGGVSKTFLSQKFNTSVRNVKTILENKTWREDGNNG